MNGLKDLKFLSLDFRRKSSQLLNSDEHNADVNLCRFVDFIESTPTLRGIVHDVADRTEYDFLENVFCLRMEAGSKYRSPLTKRNISKQYMTMQHILQILKRRVLCIIHAGIHVEAAKWKKLYRIT